MGWKIIWTRSALDDLAAIVSFIAESDSGAAEKVGDRIVDHVEILAGFPEIGPLYKKRQKGDVRQILCGKFRIFYRFGKDSREVKILHIWHGSRQEPDVFE